ncbi:MAG TPA: PKD domain-containing protein [Candidatus Paceibacterota bacterium]
MKKTLVLAIAILLALPLLAQVYNFGDRDRIKADITEIMPGAPTVQIEPRGLPAEVSKSITFNANLYNLPKCYGLRWDFGDGDVYSTYPTCSDLNAPKLQNTSIAHTYRNTGTYRVTLTVDGVMSNTLSMNVRNISGTMLAVTSPNGGEFWFMGSEEEISWVGNGNSFDILLVPHPADIEKTVIKNFLGSSFVWSVGQILGDEAVLPDGSYYVKVCLAGDKLNCDTSDNYFEIKTVK